MSSWYAGTSVFCVGDTVVRRNDCMHVGMWSDYMSRADQVSHHVIEKISGRLIKLKGYEYAGWVDAYFTLVQSGYRPIEEGEYL